jgi:hypothetical protein
MALKLSKIYKMLLTNYFSKQAEEQKSRRNEPKDTYIAVLVTTEPDANKLIEMCVEVDSFGNCRGEWEW